MCGSLPLLLPYGFFLLFHFCLYDPLKEMLGCSK